LNEVLAAGDTEQARQAFLTQVFFTQFSHWSIMLWIFYNCCVNILSLREATRGWRAV